MQSQETLSIHIAEEEWILHALRAAYWPKKELLVISDVHLGKGSHFRKHGIAVPYQILEQNIHNIQTLLDHFQPKELLFLGDLFHSNYNHEWEYIPQLIQANPKTHFSLLLGNHDILPESHYEKAGLQLYKEVRLIRPFCFSHEPIPKANSEHYTIAGHVHPGVQLKGAGRQQVVLPCFYFGKNQCVLPAFGSFTGKHKIKPVKGEKIVVVGDGFLKEFDH